MTAAPGSRSVKTADDPPHELVAPLPMVERFLGDYLATIDLPANLAEATRYALLGGGKRLRPILVLHSCAAVGGAFESCLPAAAAVEMIHAFSLVHDDLPALDNDDLRRGRPTVHVAYGEALAILVGDGLMSLAFQILNDRISDPRLAGLLCAELAVGSTNMIAGQVLDTLGGFPSGLTSRDQLDQIHRNKTGALIRASCRMGGLCGLRTSDPADSARALQALTTYGDAVGLMFQIVDDLIDVEQTPEHSGKKTSKDQDAGKRTFPGLLGIEASRREIERLHIVANSALEFLGPRASALKALSDYLAVRTR